MAQGIAAINNITDGQRVEYRGYARRYDMGVVGEHGRMAWPDNTRPWRKVLFKVVCMQLHQSRNQIGSLAILGFGCSGIAPIYSVDQTIPDFECAGKYLGFSHNTGVGEQ